MKVKRLAGLIGGCMICVCAAAGCGSNSTGASAGQSKADSAQTQEAAGAEENTQAEGEDQAEENAQAEAAESEENEEGKEDSDGSRGYTFVSNEVEITVDMDMSAVEEQLGEPVNYYEEPSCAAQGTARIYTYSGFEIETYPDGDKDLIACVVLKDDSVATPEGVDLSMTKDDIIAAYGPDYEESETSMVYERNGTKLCFILDGDDIASIEYDSPVLN